MHLFVIYSIFLFITVTHQDESVISFKPNSISLAVGDQKSVNVRLIKLDIIFPISIQFLYNGKLNDSQGYIDIIPDITFINDTTTDRSQNILITGRNQGHLVITAQSSRVNISTVVDYLLIDIARSNVLSIFVQIVGWIYFAAWSISFYPQIILNFQRRSVIGLNFDFLALNIIGHSCYSVFNLYLYTSSTVQQEYFALHPHGVLPVLLNDVIFSCHAVFACLITVAQCLFFERGAQRVSYTARVIGAVCLVFLFVSTIVSTSKHLSTLNLLYFFSYVKLFITIIKYCPQAWMNYKRKSTEGWSIGNILLDFTGGTLSLLQMFFLASNYNDWSSIFGSPTKLGLGLFSIIFDILFIVQHYVLYRTHDGINHRINHSSNESDENSPILLSTA
ncbi:unnamed protein product [Adineta steineri]|uniref:Cystinosin homolog n=1 Tax=Adineta steineri TaxID=433720 RepID=A0A814BNA9_9BILA|nr:unnamed protein product [Adineta steineri]CAF0929046.1 unnamed protein product [Adineta steineri]